MNRGDPWAGRRRGSVLILALWTLFFLATLALAIGARVGASLRVAEAMKREGVSRRAASSGAALATYRVLADTNEWDGMAEDWCSDDKAFRALAVGQGRVTVSHIWSTGDGAVVTNYGLADEERRININRADVGLLAAVFEVAGKLDTVRAGGLAAAIVDWRDADDVPLTGGAESGYYETLRVPYRCPNAPFQSLEELRLVRGMADDVVERAMPYLTVHGTGKVNLNTAEGVVLKSLGLSGSRDSPGACEALAAKIELYRRAGGAFRVPAASAVSRELNRFAALTPQEDGVLLGMMGTATLQSTCFRGTAEGSLKGQAGARIDFVFDRSSRRWVEWHER